MGENLFPSEWDLPEKQVNRRQILQALCNIALRAILAIDSAGLGNRAVEIEPVQVEAQQPLHFIFIHVEGPSHSIPQDQHLTLETSTPEVCTM